jgi:hypothetical protein
MRKNREDLVVYSLTDVGRKRGNNEDPFLYTELEGKGGSTAYGSCRWNGRASRR